MSTSATDKDVDFFRETALVMALWLTIVLVVGLLLVLYGDVLTALV